MRSSVASHHVKQLRDAANSFSLEFLER
jgi:hypothetical protein